MVFHVFQVSKHLFMRVWSGTPPFLPVFQVFHRWQNLNRYAQLNQARPRQRNGSGCSSGLI